jgi:hypothetical protein
LSRLAKSSLHVYFLLALPLVLLSIYPTRADTSEEIFHWVASQLNIEYAGDMPEIRFVDKKSLCTIFTRNNQKSYRRWKARYGVLQAQRILNIYLIGLVGLFDPETSIVYVADFLNPCRQQSVVAHEITHFFQYRTRPITDQSELAASSRRLHWEIEAHQIENRFVQLHCPDQAE